MDQTLIIKVQLTVQGITNMFGFFLLVSSSESIAVEFGQKNLVPLSTFLATIMSVTVLFINALFLMDIPPKMRLVANAVIMGLGYAVIAIG